MATNILMPALSPTMTEGNLARWLKKEGDQVKAGDIIAEIETDKATMEVEAVDEGILGKILVADGTQGVKVNDPIAVLVEPGESADAAPAPKSAGGGGAAQSASPSEAAALEATKDGKVAGAAEQPVAMPQPQSGGGTAPAPKSNGHDAGGERVFASPLARRMAQQAGLDLNALQGSGPGGRIVKADIEAALSKGPAAKPQAPAPQAAAPAPQPAAAPAPKPAAPVVTAPHTPVPNSSMRKVIARRLSESKQTVPHFYVSMDFEIDALLKLRADLNAKSAKDGPGAFKLSVNDMVIKAVAATLRRYPNVNAIWTDDAILQLHDVDISIAVSTPAGLITPIIRRADQKGLSTISNEMKELAGRAKANKLKPEEFQGGGFSISNMGMYGVKEFSAIINPPQAGILAVAAGEQRPVVKGGQLAVATVMTCTLSVDHRVIDGALAAEFMQALKGVIEDPLSLML
ncbi:pyruvate dehydrogenase complex dihydrolipoamide acetyltransferase [Paracraurococcus ruber]|uniref:Acetyltransferase component of pyruvate dehydrogenase complex n=1 Tax=Paracraurococcus ruber TaxID=77675 RepID=A0ABS1CX10_9PROT|nr:pyruvate dehydrogenase complex dihydrolipoamide acetyltransferase [Paracraurococcus ruber]MBK1658903.1 pyruvate dehydrogenase complex dihydrolipoamide acetyltransferase [Paracraurococcus ruber]TDG30855.1 pyruvate dehydrogenase complex dihydrolipoamide acetyltransferase [Paracraurococcus ruber]